MISHIEYSELHEWTKNYIDTKCIVRNTPMPGKKPGSRYTWMFYLRNGLFNHEFSSAVSQMFLYKIMQEVGHFDFQITGLETASTPMLASIPLVSRVFGLDLNAFSIRKQKKEYGLLNIIEGIPNDKPCLLIDDLCNSSESLWRAYNTLLNEKLEVLDFAFCIVNKVNKEIHEQSRQSTDMYLPEHMKMIYLFDLDDFSLFGTSH
jgi:orotate phosphoribosyltransferase